MLQAGVPGQLGRCVPPGPVTSWSMVRASLPDLGRQGHVEVRGGSGAGWAAEIPAWLSVIIVAAILLITVLAGMTKTGRAPGQATAVYRQTRLSAEERTALERRFAVIDTDGNGVWQRDDCQLLTPAPV